MDNNRQQWSEEGTAILDSNLIVATRDLYDIKLVECGDYCQVYIYNDRKPKRKIKDNNIDLELKKRNIEQKFVFNKQIKSPEELKGYEHIEQKNIIRSKLECQRLAKANINEWKTFITLTFEENITDVQHANKRFKYFIDKVRRVKKDIKYLCITEFQKRGATHYHMLSNIDINDENLIYKQEDNPKFKHVKYWNDGFTSVEVMQGDAKKVIGYIAKYMTKNIDNRLFNRHRYFYSRNLKRPIANYINCQNVKEKDFYLKKIQDKELIYQNEYINPYDETNVLFLEFKK